LPFFDGAREAAAALIFYGNNDDWNQVLQGIFSKVRSSCEEDYFIAV
jgi:hypothetical protein